jgi:hypothetical protein
MSPGYLRRTAALTAASSGLPAERASAFIAWDLSGIGYDPEPGALSGKTKSLFGSALRCSVVSFAIGLVARTRDEVSITLECDTRI